jgi:hypothetical protein
MVLQSNCRKHLRVACILPAALMSTHAVCENRDVAITSANHSFLSAEGGGGGQVHANRPARGPWESFRISNNVSATCGPPGQANCGPLKSGDHVCILTNNNHFLVAESGGGREVNASRPECGSWETFQIFLLGPSPAGLFPVPGNPTIPSSGSPPVAFRASDGGWVTAEGGGGGDVNANRPAIGAWERWNLFQ